MGDAAETDAARVAWIVRKVVEDADALELALLPGHDEPLGAFRTGLEGEVADGD